MISETQAVCQILETAAQAGQQVCTVDLGAHCGEDTAWMLDAMRYYPSSRAIMVEADQDNFAIIESRQLPAKAIFGAISDHTGVCNFWPCETGRGSGSIRRPTGHTKTHPHFVWKDPITIPCFTLDDIFMSESLDHIDVLWVDIQGAERDMIVGGRKALKHTRSLFIEAEEHEMYEGQAIRDDLLRMLPGWKTTHYFDFNLLLVNTEFA